MAKSLSPSKKRMNFTQDLSKKLSANLAIMQVEYHHIACMSSSQISRRLSMHCSSTSSRAVFLSIPSSCREFIRQFDGTEAVASSRLLHIPSFSLPSPLSPLSLSPSHLNGCIMELGGVEITSVIAIADAAAAALPRNPVQPASERVPRGEGRIGYTPPLTKRGVYRCPAPPSLGPAPPGRQSPRGSD